MAGGGQESFMRELAREKSLPLAISSFIVLPGDSAGGGTGKGIHLNSVFDGVARPWKSEIERRKRENRFLN